MYVRRGERRLLTGDVGGERLPQPYLTHLAIEEFDEPLERRAGGSTVGLDDL